MKRDISEILKDLYTRPIEPTEDLNKKTLQKMKESRETSWHGFLKPVTAAGLMAAVLAVFLLIPNTSLAENIKNYFKGFWASEKEVDSYVKKSVFQDSDEHVSVSIEELLSDEICAELIVKLEARDKFGEKWLAERKPGTGYFKALTTDEEDDMSLFLRLENRNGGCGYPTFLNNYSTEKVYYYALEYDATNTSDASAKGTFVYHLPGKELKTTVNLTCNVPVYHLQLAADGKDQNQKYFRAKYARLTCLSCLVYGTRSVDLKKAEEIDKNSVDIIQKYSKTQYEKAHEMIVASWMENMNLIRKDGKIIKADESMVGANGSSLSTSEKKEYPGCDYQIGRFSFCHLDYSFDKKSEKVKDIKPKLIHIDPKKITGIELGRNAENQKDKKNTTTRYLVKKMSKTNRF